MLPVARWCLGLASVLVLLLPAAAAEPVDDSRQRATELFEQGRQLMDEGDYDAACELLRQSFELAQGVGIQFNLAQCLEAQGKLASARRHFAEAAEVAERAGQRERADVARARASDLQSRVSTLTITMGSPAPGQQIHVAGLVLGPAQWESPVELDPGNYEVKAQAPGCHPWTAPIQVPTEAAQLAIEIPKLRARASAARRPPTAMVPEVSPAEERDDGAQLVAGLVLGGAGLVALGVGTGFGLSAMSQHGDSEAYCDATGCEPEGLDLIEQAQLAGDVSTGLFIGGAVLLVGGIVLVVTAPTDTDEGESSAGLSFELGAGPRAAMVHGRWCF